MGRWKHGVEQILAVAGMQNQETERKTLARQISNKEGALCAAHAENQKKGHNFNRFNRRARPMVAENNLVPMGPSRGYLVQKEGPRKLRHDGVATCYEKRGKTQPKTARGGKRQFRSLL